MKYPSAALTLFLFSLQGTSSSEDPYRSLYYIPAYLDSPCDPEFHTKYVEPIYKTENYHDFRRAALAWGDALTKLGKENETCFGAPEPPADAGETFIFFTCDKETKKCECHSSGFMKQVRKGDECQFVESQLGDQCDYARMKEVNNDPKTGLGQFYRKLADVKKSGSSQLSSILKGHLDAMKDYTFQPWAARRICYSPDSNLECKPNGKCGCLDIPPYLRYKPKGGICVGLTNSICELTVEAYMDWTGYMIFDTIRKAQCEIPGQKCEKLAEAGAQTIKICRGGYN